MENKIKKIDIKEFREKGYLQEINRRFLHPLGLALEIVINDDNTEALGGIWDNREEEEGIYYDISNSPIERINKFKNNKEFIDEEFMKRSIKRINNLGFNIEPIN